jgi:K+ transporter
LVFFLYKCLEHQKLVEEFFIIELLKKISLQGLTFGPIMIIWFAALFSIGIWRITFDPSILHAFNPWEALSYLIREKQTGFLQIGM